MSNVVSVVFVMEGQLVLLWWDHAVLERAVWGVLLYAVRFLGRALASGGIVCIVEGISAF